MVAEKIGWIWFQRSLVPHVLDAVKNWFRSSLRIFLLLGEVRDFYRMTKCVSAEHFHVIDFTFP